MRKLLGILLGTILMAPLPSLADDLTVHQDYHSDDEPLYVSNDVSLIQLTLDGSDVQGAVWSNSSHAWSAATTIFTDSGTVFSLDESDFVAIDELANGTIVLSQGDDFISYSVTNGFQHFTQDTDVYDVVIHRNKATLVNYCTSGEHTATLWSETDGMGTTTTLAGSTCTADLSYFAGARAVLVDYYSGVAYNINDAYSVFDTVDLSSLGYVDGNDDFDPQGNNPDLAVKKSGDLVFAFDNHLFGYARHDQEWRDVVTLDAGYTIIGEAGAEYSYRLMETGNRKGIFAFAGNDDQTDYTIYRWSSDAGWSEDETYSFAESAELIDTNSDGQDSKLHWGFWLPDSSQELSIYTWSAGSYTELTNNTLTCADCNITLDVSQKGKLFVVAHSGSGTDNTSLQAWKPSTALWETYDFPNNLNGNYTSTHVTDNGQLIVTYQKNNSTYGVIRWTPNNGWGAQVELGAEEVQFNGDHVHYITLDSADELAVNRYHWSSASSTTADTITDVAQLDDGFIYDDYYFVFYIDTSDVTAVSAVAF